jgi:hypothetical protein
LSNNPRKEKQERNERMPSSPSPSILSPVRKRVVYKSLEEEHVRFQRSGFTLKKEQFLNNQNVDLVKDLAYWLSGASDRYVSERNFEMDLCDGVALCSLLTKVHGSGVTTYHKVAPVGGIKARENLISFQIAARRLNLPVTFGYDDL